MEAERLRHIVKHLPDLLLGSYNAHVRLARAGGGKLEIDALTGDCTLDGAPADELGIGAQTRVWLMQQLAERGVALATLQRARILVDLRSADGVLDGIAVWGFDLEGEGEIKTVDGTRLLTPLVARVVYRVARVPELLPLPWTRFPHPN